MMFTSLEKERWIHPVRKIKKTPASAHQLTDQGALLLFAMLSIACESTPSSENRLPQDIEITITTDISLSKDNLNASHKPNDYFAGFLDEMMTRFPKAVAPRADEECCSDPGEIATCWWRDAERDGVTCENDAQCRSGNTCDKTVATGDLDPPNGWGLCTCDSDSDCGDGVCRDGRCGPSFCNGYLVCSCWGGCTEANTGVYDTPDAMCGDTDQGYPGECCEGNYPSAAEGAALGFCSNFCSAPGGRTCEQDIDCNDGNPCTEDSCDANNRCFFDPIANAPPVTSNSCAAPLGILSSDCVAQWCISGKCTWRATNADAACQVNPQGIESSWHGALEDHIRLDNTDGTSCIYARCDAAGHCDADPLLADNLRCGLDDTSPCTDAYCGNGLCLPDDGSAHEGDLCNAGDDDACGVDMCISGSCEQVDTTPCDDDNWCTYPDHCIDDDPLHIAYDCANPEQPNGANIETLGYVDTDPCIDIICYDANETEVTVVCIPPDTLHLTCNDYACDPFGAEDNCTVTPINDGTHCNDDNGCTIGEVCENGACGTDSTPRKVCDDNNICTTDSCQDGPAGNCRFDGAPNDGAACSDGDSCTGAEAILPNNDVCSGGVCTAGPARDCSGAMYDDDCHQGVCDAATGACVSEVIENNPCDDGNPCTISDTCNAVGDCVGETKSCTGDQCNFGVCNPSTGACERSPYPDGTGCSASDGTGQCTPNDTCQSGVCKPDTAHQVICTGDACNTVYCDPADGMCKYDNAANLNISCDGILDTDPCTLDACVGAGATSPLTCTRIASNDISSWYSGDIVGTLTVDGIPGNADTLTDASQGNAQGYLLSGTTSGDPDAYDGATGSSGWDGRDHVWEIVYTGSTPATLTFSGCHFGGTGDFDGQMILVDCAESSIAEDDDGCGNDGMPTFDVTMTPGETYFLVMDGHASLDSGDYAVAIYYDHCSDGILNSDEVLVDSGGSDCCSNGKQNGNEDDVDRGGACCQDGLLNGDETEVDCGGAYCDPCIDLCANGVLDSGELEVDCGGTCPIVCTSNADCPADHVCNATVSACGACLPLACSGPLDPELTVGHYARIEMPLNEGCTDVYVGDQNELYYIHYGDRNLKLQADNPTSASGACDFTSPNYTYVYSTKYCVTYQGQANKTYAEFISCPVWGYTTGSGRLTGPTSAVLIPVEQYTLSARVSFVENGDSCVLNANVYWE